MDMLIMRDNSLKTQAFKLKGRLYTLTVLYLLDNDLALFEKELLDKIKTAPRLFEHTPVVLDCSGVSLEDFDLQAFCQCMRLNSVIPVAIQGGNLLLETLARAQGMAVLHASAERDKFLDSPEPLETISTKMLTTQVRSGQQVVSKGGDLVIVSTVSRGAEVLADGNIHVYGTLRGRALAGISGNTEARIFCQELEAELVAIAGFYCLRDALEVVSGPCQIFLQNDKIQISKL
jgi:septum site-determining protein MinC